MSRSRTEAPGGGDAGAGRCPRPLQRVIDAMHAAGGWMFRSPRPPYSLRDAAWGAAWFTIAWGVAAVVTYLLFGELY